MKAEKLRMPTARTGGNDHRFLTYDDLRKTVLEQLGDIDSRPGERVRVKPPTSRSRG
ncbi:hypothetical protein [Nonomuraea terrae]|uniref:hypothetical protein n=1 Tax=Nonomuraea terrae TaxID=2530383 RepID=UPI00140452A2|nr:hypothetical protein [Nonomuraea terrae]